ncbi:M23 family metallopeptidase [Nocardioides sp.]|uniref:M23 family metallopeptidase n=1 Tax=Nocardioides sp. TaxID=35761 RepID=UPI00271B4ABE|nr:M23 family metallopeptidase [Nocardioides sp.]MDO9457764.1 peptidoglycan DD-metalloendopeptidase family protein [Nocardioides sp.]
MRFFPSAARQRVTVACVGLVSLAALAVPLAHADEDDDLKSRQREVKGKIADAASDLKEASREVTRASARLSRATEQLSAARTELAGVRTRLAAARERDARLKAELATAELELEQASAALASGVAAVEHQRDVVRDAAISIYSGNDSRLQAIGSLLDSGSIEELEERRLGAQVIGNRQTAIFADLEEVEADLADEQADVEDKAEAVEQKRREAAAHLEEVRGLYDESVAAEARVQSLVGEARTARQQAFAARARDRQTLRALKAREDRIQQQLVALARSQRDQVGFKGQSDGYLSYPASGPVTSPYGYRVHPIYGYYSLHNGTDFGTGCGAPVYASAGGTVIDTYYDSVYGNRLYLSLGKVNGKSLVLIYNHLSAYKASEGQKVERGTVLGLSGTTGWSTGCHLHFTVMENGVAVNPMNYL